MGLFDFPAPVFAVADRLIGSAMPRWTIPVFWGVVAASIASWVYYKLSPQERIDRLKHEAEQARAAMLAYDGDFDGVLPLASRTLKLAGERLALSIGPAIAASLPALFLIGYLDNAYSHIEPDAGAAIAVRTEPAQAPVTWLPAGWSRDSDGTWRIRWPRADAPVRLTSAQGGALVTFPLHSPVPVLGKFGWWNYLYGNPAGYLPADAPVNPSRQGCRNSS